MVRRCHISCRVESANVMGEIIACNAFTSLNKKSFSIYFMVAAYNAETKDARIYAESERVSERIIDHQLQTMGAGSVVIDSFSSGDWEMASEAAFNSVIECGAKPGYSLQERGDEQRRARRYLNHNNNGAEKIMSLDGGGGAAAAAAVSKNPASSSSSSGSDNDDDEDDHNDDDERVRMMCSRAVSFSYDGGTGTQSSSGANGSSSSSQYTGKRPPPASSSSPEEGRQAFKGSKRRASSSSFNDSSSSGDCCNFDLPATVPTSLLQWTSQMMVKNLSRTIYDSNTMFQKESARADEASARLRDALKESASNLSRAERAELALVKKEAGFSSMIAAKNCELKEEKV